MLALYPVSEFLFTTLCTEMDIIIQALPDCQLQNIFVTGDTLRLCLKAEMCLAERSVNLMLRHVCSAK